MRKHPTATGRLKPLRLFSTLLPISPTTIPARLSDPSLWLPAVRDRPATALARESEQTNSRWVMILGDCSATEVSPWDFFSNPHLRVQIAPHQRRIQKKSQTQRQRDDSKGNRFPHLWLGASD